MNATITQVVSTMGMSPVRARHLSVTGAPSTPAVGVDFAGVKSAGFNGTDRPKGPDGGSTG